MLQNQPNPFNDNTNITFYLPESGVVDMSITDMNGRIIQSQSQYYEKGTNSVLLDASALGGSGIYYYTITTASDKKTMRMILLH